MEWLGIVREIEAIYPRAAGGSNLDETLRRRLVPWANKLMVEIDRLQRWSLAYGQVDFDTVAGTASYTASGVLKVKRVFRLDESGMPLPIDSYDTVQNRRVYGQGADAPRGAPKLYSITGRTITLYPVPDDVYEVFVEGYLSVDGIIETTATTVAASSDVTVPDALFLSQQPNELDLGGLPTAGFEIRDAGYVQYGTVRNDFIGEGWTAINTGTNKVTLTSVAPVSLSTKPFYLRTRNWILEDYGDAILFGVLRKVASRLKDDYKQWESRYQHEIELMREADVDRSVPDEISLVGISGENVPVLRNLDFFVGYEIRGA